jgi:enterobacterial common antigen flippase
LNKTSHHTYGQILKSSTLIGGSSLLSVCFGIVRTKAMALLLGPTGVGLLGLYGSISDLTRTAAGMGVNNSGVRQIAEAVGTGDAHRIARTVTTLRRVAFCSGAVGALLLLAFSKPVAWLTFHDDQHTSSVALLALAVFFGDVSAGQAALVQGMRRIADLARMSILGAFYGTLFAIIIVYFMRERGVVPSLVCAAVMSILTSWWYARRVKVERVPLTWRQVLDEASALLRLGIVFMACGLMTTGAGYLVRIIVLKQINLEAAGFYQSAWALGGFYIGFILQAMGADFYPRLTAVASDNAECNRLVNEQAEVGVLLAVPGVIATLVFAPLVIHVFYSAKFEPAVEILRWICLGMMLRVAIWPMGFIMLAKAERALFFWTELFGNVTYVCLAWVGIKCWGLTGTGIAFFGMYVVYWICIQAVVRRLSGFRWSSANLRLALLFVPVATAVFLSWYVPSRGAAAASGLVLTLLAGAYSLRRLCALIPHGRLPRAARTLLVLLRLDSARADGEKDGGRTQ